MPVLLVHEQLRLVVGAPESKGDEPGVQQARMVGILDVLLHELPVARHPLARVAENGELASVEHALEIRQYRGPDVLREGRHLGMERGEDHAVVDRDL